MVAVWKRWAKSFHCFFASSSIDGRALAARAESSAFLSCSSVVDATATGRRDGRTVTPSLNPMGTTCARRQPRRRNANGRPSVTPVRAFRGNGSAAFSCAAFSQRQRAVSAGNRLATRQPVATAHLVTPSRPLFPPPRLVFVATNTRPRRHRRYSRVANA